MQRLKRDRFLFYARRGARRGREGERRREEGERRRHARIRGSFGGGPRFSIDVAHACIVITLLVRRESDSCGRIAAIDDTKVLGRSRLEQNARGAEASKVCGRRTARGRRRAEREDRTLRFLAQRQRRPRSARIGICMNDDGPGNFWQGGGGGRPGGSGKVSVQSPASQNVAARSHVGRESADARL